MSMLAFFPWLRIKENIDLGEVELVRFIKCYRPGKNQQIYDRILESYVLRDKYNTPIKESTLLILKDKCDFQDFSEEEKNYLFSISEIIAFSGLSKREYFNTVHLGYCNRDNFAFFIQSFRQDSNDIHIVTTPRFRDCPELHVSNKEFIPPHVSHGNFIDLDIPLVKSLMKAREDYEKWELYNDAIFHFNLANTDNYSISPYQEVVLIVSAFERLLDCNNKGQKREDDLIAKFLYTFKPKEDLDKNKSARIRNSKYAKSDKTLREIWLRDFYQLRGDYAHGNLSSKRSPIWKAHEHLLLGSYIFPLVVKCKLEKDGFYTLTENDKPEISKLGIDIDMFNIDVFERLVGAELFNKTEDQSEFEWNRIRESYMLEWIKVKAMEHLQQIKEIGGE